MTSMLSEKETNSIAEQEKCHSPWKVYPSWQYDLLVQNYDVQNVKLIYMVRHAEGWHNVNRNFKSIENMDARLTPLGKNQCYKLRDEILLSKKETGATKDIVNVEERHPGNESYRRRQGLEHLINEKGEDNDDSDICVVVSPLTRCIQTALLAFDFLAPTASPGKQKDKSSSSNSENGVSFFALEALRETVNYNCDRRRRISEVANEFPQIDFSFCRNDEDEIWMNYQKRQKDQLERNGSGSKSDQADTNASTKKNYLESAELYVVAKRGRQALEFLQSLQQSKIVVSTHSAYLRCILNWGQTGGVPRMFAQTLDDREDPTRQDKLFDYCYNADDCSDEEKSEIERASFEEYMREDYENAEMRSFCLLVK